MRDGTEAATHSRERLARTRRWQPSDGLCMRTHAYIGELVNRVVGGRDGHGGGDGDGSGGAASSSWPSVVVVFVVVARHAQWRHTTMHSTQARSRARAFPADTAHGVAAKRERTQNHRAEPSRSAPRGPLLGGFEGGK